MHNQTCPRRSWALWCTTCTASVALLAGCQSYERVPLDLDAYNSALAARSSDHEPLHGFIDRLAEAGRSTPERFDLSDGLSPAEGEVFALFYNPGLRIARLDAGIALASYDNAGLWEDPRFGFDAAEILSPAGVTEYGLTLSLTIPISGRLAVEKDRAGAAYEAELRRVVHAEWSLRADVRSAWAAWTAEHARVDLLAEVVAQVERVSSITEQLVSAGELTRVESRLIRAEALSLRNEAVAARRALAEARIRLLGLLGLPADAEIKLLAAFPPVVIPETDDEARRLIASNTSLALRRAEYRVAEETLRLEVRRQYPDITIGGGYGSEDDDRLLLGVSLPIPILNANRGGIAEARARRERVRAIAETTFEQLTRESAVSRAALDAAREQRAAFESDLVPLLALQASEVEQLAALGEVNTLLLLETITRGFEARSVLLELRVAELSAANEITRLLGPETEEMPSPVQNPPEINHPGGESSAEEAPR